jgi:hypothetical protein
VISQHKWTPNKIFLHEVMKRIFSTNQHSRNNLTLEIIKWLRNDTKWMDWPSTGTVDASYHVKGSEVDITNSTRSYWINIYIYIYRYSKKYKYFYVIWLSLLVKICRISKKPHPILQIFPPQKKFQYPIFVIMKDSVINKIIFQH